MFLLCTSPLCQVMKQEYLHWQNSIIQNIYFTILISIYRKIKMIITNLLCNIISSGEKRSFVKDGEWSVIGSVWLN